LFVDKEGKKEGWTVDKRRTGGKDVDDEGKKERWEGRVVLMS
jgi:hypothetical protein